MKVAYVVLSQIYMFQVCFTFVESNIYVSRKIILFSKCGYIFKIPPTPPPIVPIAKDHPRPPQKSFEKHLF